MDSSLIQQLILTGSMNANSLFACSAAGLMFRTVKRFLDFYLVEYFGDFFASFKKPSLSDFYERNKEQQILHCCYCSTFL